MRRTLKLFALALVAVAFASGCKTLAASQGGDPDYAASADVNLKRGQDALHSKNYQEAEKYFDYVKGKYPFLEAAKTAELLLADTTFEKENYTEARDQYLNFVKLHPTHPRVDYASFRAALTHYKDLPSNFFLLPPAEEKDQSEVRSALKAMKEFVRQFPQSASVTEANKIVEDAMRRLAQHEIYVARFYAKREKWKAVVGRLEGLCSDYPGIPLPAEVPNLLVRGYSALKTPELASASLKRLIERFPGTDAAQRAKHILGS